MTSSGLSAFPLFASLCAVAPVEDAEEPTTRVFIKHTFVHVFDDDYLASIAIQQKRRSNSAPPACRTSCAAARSRACALEHSIHESIENPIQESMECIPCSSTSPYSCSLASTSAKADSEDDMTCSSEACDDDSSDDDSMPTAAPTPEGGSSRRTRVLWCDDDSEDDYVPMAAPTSQAVAPAGPGTFLLQLSECLPPPPRAVLKSSAKAWTSNGLRSHPSEVRIGFAEIVAAGKSSLMAASGITKVQASENAGGLSLVASIQDAQSGSAEAALGHAGEAMLAAALRSESVYVVGYEQDPFKPLHEELGFRAQLAVVHDEALACWDLLAKGVCSRGCSCKWQHPAFQTTVSVSFEVVSPSRQ